MYFIHTITSFLVVIIVGIAVLRLFFLYLFVYFFSIVIIGVYCFASACIRIPSLFLFGSTATRFPLSISLNIAVIKSKFYLLSLRL
jgi:hypothetical protein